MKKLLCIALLCTMTFAQVLCVSAAEPAVNSATERPDEEEITESEEVSETEEADAETSEDAGSDSVGDEETGQEAVNAKPYLALGADLSEEQLGIVLDAMGITRDQLADYNVVYITNDMEHEYLDGYIAASVIGTKSLSSVMVKQKPAGSGLMVTTKNITYCTISMYKNALITSGVEDAEIMIVGPSPISGTAALIGAMKAYENLSGETLSDEAQDVAVEELVVMGELISSGEDAEAMEEFIEYVKAEVIASGLTDPEEIRKLVEEAAEKFQVVLSEENLQKITSLMEKIGSLDIDPSKLLEQAGDLYEKYGETILKDAKEMLDNVFTEEVKTSIWEAISNFFKSLWDTITGWFQQ